MVNLSFERFWKSIAKILKLKEKISKMTVTTANRKDVTLKASKDFHKAVAIFSWYFRKLERNVSE